MCAGIYTSRRRPNTRVADDVLRVANSPCRHVRSNQGTRRGMRSHSCSADRGRPGRGCRASGGGGGATWTLLTPETFTRLPCALPPVNPPALPVAPPATSVHCSARRASQGAKHLADPAAHPCTHAHTCSQISVGSHTRSKSREESTPGTVKSVPLQASDVGSASTSSPVAPQSSLRQAR